MNYICCRHHWKDGVGLLENNVHVQGSTVPMRNISIINPEWTL